MIIPIFINRILKYFDGQADLKTTLLNGCLMSFLVTVNCILHHPYFLNTYKLGFKIRVACSGLIYKKAVRLKLCGLDSQSNGHVLNMLANDLIDDYYETGGGEIIYNKTKDDLYYFIADNFAGYLQEIYNKECN